MTTDTKYFTPAEARRTLPLVRKIVQDILDTAREMRLLAEGLQGKVENDPQIRMLADQVEGFMKELEEIGCSYKDPNFNTGLVDFPSVINGEDVLLCWQSEEDDIRFYHKADSGFANRKPIPSYYFDDI